MFEETALGMQDYLLAKELPSDVQHHSAVWTCSIPNHDDAHGLLLVKWLEEILYMDEVEEKWLVDCSVKLEPSIGWHSIGSTSTLYPFK